MGDVIVTNVRLHNSKNKPKLRGVSHEIAAYLAVIAGSSLIWNAVAARVAALIYSLSVFFLFAVSALYHRPFWKPAQRQLWRRIDHSAIYILISGTLTPLALLGLEGTIREYALITLGAMAFLGVSKSLFWIRAPKPVSAALFVALALAFLPFLPALANSVGTASVVWLLIGAAIYVLGAVIYVLKKPNPAPGVFGYHEIFHALVIVAAGLHYWVVGRVILK